MVEKVGWQALQPPRLGEVVATQMVPGMSLLAFSAAADSYRHFAVSAACKDCELWVGAMKGQGLDIEPNAIVRPEAEPSQSASLATYPNVSD